MNVGGKLPHPEKVQTPPSRESATPKERYRDGDLPQSCCSGVAGAGRVSLWPEKCVAASGEFPDRLDEQVTEDSKKCLRQQSGDFRNNLISTLKRSLRITSLFKEQAPLPSRNSPHLLSPYECQLLAKCFPDSMYFIPFPP